MSLTPAELPGDELALSELEAIMPADPALLEVAEQTTYGEILLADLMQRQLVLAIGVAAAFLAVLLGLPLLDLFLPALAATQLFGLPLSWLALAVLVYPFLWLLATYYVSTAKRYEDEFTRLVR